MCLLKILLNVSTVVNVLPYYSYKRDWSRVMMQLCKATHDIWNDEQKVFETMHIITNWTHNGDEIEQCFKKILNLKASVGPTWALDLNCKEEEPKTFIKEAEGLIFPEIK